MHFFQSSLVKSFSGIVVGAETATATVDATKELVDIIEKGSITVGITLDLLRVDSAVALGLEAIRMVSDGVASAADIDKAMELGYRHPMGPPAIDRLSWPRRSPWYCSKSDASVRVQI